MNHFPLMFFCSICPSPHNLHGSHALNSNTISQEVATFQTFLELIRAIAVHDDVSAVMLCEDPKWKALHLFRNLAKCPIDILLKMDILHTLAAIDEAKQKANNLDRLPVEVLMEIFANVGHADLMRLAETCRRFEPIAETVFRGRY